MVASLLMLGSAGCAVSQAAANQAPAIEVSNGYVPLPVSPGVTVGYLAIRNNGPADRLVAARISTGGRISFAVPAAQGAGGSMPWIAIPAHSLVRLVPDGPHLLITGIAHLRGGQAVTLTLVFSRAGRVDAQAVISNPAAGGGSYFFN